MIHKRLKTSGSHILTPEDLEPSLFKKNSFQFFRSDSGSPTAKSFRSQKDSFIEEDVAQLSESLSYEKDRNDCLAMEVTSLTNEVHAGNALTN